MKSTRQRLAFLVFSCALVLLGLAAAPPRVSAHASLQRTQPTNGAIVAANLGEVRLTFTEPVEVRPDRVIVSNDQGRRVDLRDAKAAPSDAATVVASLPQLPAGVYTVRYALLSSDTHPISGTLRFGVGVAPADVLAGTAPQAQAEVTPPLLIQAVGRWLNLLGLLLLLGPVAFRLFVLAPAWPRGRRAVPTEALGFFDARAVRWIWIGFGVLVLAQFVLLISASLGSSLGTVADALKPANLLATLSGRFGTLWLARFALLLVPSLALPIIAGDLELRAADPMTPHAERGSAAWWAILVGGGALAALTSLSGHAAATAPVPLSVLVDWLHLSATIVWVGGLLALALIFPRVVRALGNGDGLATLATALPRFSALALVAIQILAITGFYQVWVHIESPATLGQTLYGRTFLLKLLALVPLLILGVFNRLVITPRLRALAPPVAGEGDSEESRVVARRLWRTLWGEAALGVVVLGVVGLLTALPPARTAIAADADTGGSAAADVGSVTLAANAGTTLVNLTLGPTGNGPTVLAVILRDPSGTTIENATVALRLLPPDGATPQDVALTGRGGRFTGLGDLDRYGPWRIEATVTPQGAAAARATFALDLPSGGARSILAASDAAMNRLTGLRERQSIGAGGTPTVTTYEWAAPDRLRLTADTGGETIIIAKRRFDRVGGGQWVASEWPEPSGYRWPQYAFAKSAVEVTILGREQIDGVPCWKLAFLDSAGDARVTLWIGEQDGLVRQQRMFSVGHYMESRFTDFNIPIAIEAPTAVR